MLTRKDSIIIVGADEGVGFISPLSEYLLVIDIKTKQITVYPNKTTTTLDNLQKLFYQIINWIFWKKTYDHKTIRIKRNEMQETIKKILNYEL